MKTVNRLVFINMSIDIIDVGKGINPLFMPYLCWRKVIGYIKI